MNLRNVGEYNIGLDIGTGSVGWAVTDSEGDLLHFKGQPTWGSRIFPSASVAAEARIHRGLRRRYDRRRQRLDLLQGFFEEEMGRLDPEFFIRLRQSRLLKEDRRSDCRDYDWPLFNGEDFTEKDYYAKFPTIYHLRRWLMSADEKADLRLVYLAFHNIVKHRGNFLQQDNHDLSAKNADMGGAVEDLCRALQEWCDDLDIPCTAFDAENDIAAVLSETRARRSDLRDKMAPLLGIHQGGGWDAKTARSLARAVACAVLGLKAELANVFFLAEEKPEDGKTSVRLSKDEDVETFSALCPEGGQALFEAMQRVHSSFVLQEILSEAQGKSLSANKVAEYERYGKDLKLLKQLVRRYAPEKYDEFFRGPFYKPSRLHPQKYIYDKSQAQGYTRYNEVRGAAYDDFKKAVEDVFAGTLAGEDPLYREMMDRFGEERFLRRQKTSDNGAIPFQLHLEEMRDIIASQGEFYPFLLEHQRELESLVSFRIPYYVGPLTQNCARREGDRADGKARFAWAERLPGMEAEKVRPWNWDEVIDKDASAEKFIRRMTGTCTYLQGEPVLPKCSLLYEDYCVLNELNGARFSQDGDKSYRFDRQDRLDIMDELFRRQKKVSYKKVEDWMRRRGHANVHVEGGQGESGFESKLSSYLFFCDVFEVQELPRAWYPMMEEMILWSTLFEDRDIFREKLKRKYGDRLSDGQIRKIVQKRFTGWGRMSEELLVGLKVDTDNGLRSIMDVLREGNPNNGMGSRAMVFMEILHDDDLGFDALIDERNKARIAGDGLALEELPGSPALRRGVNQALCIVSEIVGIVGHEPENIFIEVARSDDMGKRGHRTKRRYDALKEAMKKLKEESPEFWDADVASELAGRAKASEELSEKLTLYFMQGGKSLYSGTPLSIANLSDYQVDHIMPQSCIKDDSFENKALVLASENQSKSDQMLLDPAIQRKMTPYWKALFDAKLIDEKKYASLTCRNLSEKRMKGFIARQLVETRQIVKTVQGILEGRYEHARVLPIKAALSSELREVLGLVKCREINDFHHAHDALLATEIGRFILKRHAGMYDNPIGYTHVLREFVKRESLLWRRGQAPGTATFVIKSFLRPGYDEETGEITRDDWSPDKEIARLRRFMDYRQCFISRMPEETSGAFWDATIYSPRGGSKEMRLPLKGGLDPKKYGSYSREQFAYFFIYKAMKKSKVVLEFAPVPVRIASQGKSSSGRLVEYAEQIASEGGMEFIEVVREKIYKYQLVEIDGSRLLLTGKKEVRNGVQIGFKQSEAELLGRMVQGDAVSEDEIDTLFEVVRSSIARYSRRLARALKIDAWSPAFFEKRTEEKMGILLSLISIANASTNMVDLTDVGEGKYCGCMQASFSKELSKGEGITLVDQSITGMFERRTHIGL